MNTGFGNINNENIESGYEIKFFRVVREESGPFQGFLKANSDTTPSEKPKKFKAFSSLCKPCQTGMDVTCGPTHV